MLGARWRQSGYDRRGPFSLAVFILLLCALSLDNPRDKALDRAVLQVEVDSDLADSEVFASWHAELDLKRLIKLVFVALVDDHVGVPLCDRHLEVHLLERDHLILVPTDSEQLKPLFLSGSIVIAFALLSGVLLGVQLEIVWLVNEYNIVLC